MSSVQIQLDAYTQCGLLECHDCRMSEMCATLSIDEDRQELDLHVGGGHC
jgi:hypothetical protein